MGVKDKVYYSNIVLKSYCQKIIITWIGDILLEHIMNGIRSLRVNTYKLEVEYMSFN